MSRSPDIEAAVRLATSGNVGEALSILDGSPSADAVFAHGLWHFEGRVIPRDLAVAKGSFARAEQMGSLHAANCLAAMMVTGTGASRDWSGALELLDRWSDRYANMKRQLDLIERMALDEDGLPADRIDREVLHEAPAISRITSFMLPEECEFLIEMTQARFKRATIFHEALGRFVEDPVRNSDLAGFPILLEAPYVNALNHRIAHASNTRYECGEPLQVLRYQPGQQYKLHTDAIAGMRNQRQWTFLIYLNEDFEGGETSFPEIDFEFRGAQGDALLFENAKESGEPQPAMRHAGKPVIAGKKFLASRWIRQIPPENPAQGFGPQDAMRK